MGAETHGLHSRDGWIYGLDAGAERPGKEEKGEGKEEEGRKRSRRRGGRGGRGGSKTKQSKN